MLNILQIIFSSGNFEPHMVHFIPNNIGLMWFLIIGNALIAFLYVLLPIELSYIYFKRRDFPFSWVFVAVAFFGVWCSMTHIMMIVTFWYPLYWLQGIIDAITGFVSFGTFLAFIPATRLALKLTSPEHLKQINVNLQNEIENHKKTEEELVKINQKFENKKNEFIGKKNELQEINKNMVDRELKMMELKDQLAKAQAPKA